MLNCSEPKVNQAYTLSGSSVEHRARLGEANLSFSNNSPYGHYSNNDAIAFQRDGFDPYQNSREFSSYVRNASERSFSSISNASPYQSYRTTENSRRLSFESPSSMGRADYGYQSGPPLYSSPGAHLHDPRVLQVPQDAFRRPNVESPSSIGRPGYSYQSDPPSYSSPSTHIHVPGSDQLERNASRTPPYEWRSPHQTTYGSPYASSAPMPPTQTPPPVNHPHGSWYR